MDKFPLESLTRFPPKEWTYLPPKGQRKTLPNQWSIFYPRNFYVQADLCNKLFIHVAIKDGYVYICLLERVNKTALDMFVLMDFHANPPRMDTPSTQGTDKDFQLINDQIFTVTNNYVQADLCNKLFIYVVIYIAMLVSIYWSESAKLPFSQANPSRMDTPSTQGTDKI